MTDLVPITELLDVETGELLPATVPNAAAVLLAAREMKARINSIVNETTRFLVEESTRQGTKTLVIAPRVGEDFHAPWKSIVLNGGLSEEYDAHDLRVELEHAGCPENRIEEAIVAEVTYKVNRSVLRQLAGANPDYKAAIERARREVDRPYRASVK